MNNLPKKERKEDETRVTTKQKKRIEKEEKTNRLKEAQEETEEEREEQKARVPCFTLPEYWHLRCKPIYLSSLTCPGGREGVARGEREGGSGWE